MTLREALDTRDNALNFVRLVLAGLVIVSHTWPAGGFGKDPHVGDLTLGSWAVAGFFAISGYLVTGSRMHLSLGQFAARRVLRIFPGFWVCLLVVAFVFAPVAALVSGAPFDLAAAASFIWSNATTVITQWGIGGELGHAPSPHVWDASLWTLSNEVACYVVAGLVLCFGWARRDVTRAAVAAFVALTVFNVAGAQIGLLRGRTELVDFPRLAVYFAAGSLLWSLRGRVTVNRWAVLGSVGAVVLFAGLGVVDLVGALPLAYLVLAFGGWCPTRWGARRDLSYGVYVYAWPVQQSLVLAGVARFGPAVLMAAAVACVVPLAWLSWTLVERPALGLVRHRSPVAALAQAGLHRGAASGSGHGPAEAVVTLDLPQRQWCGNATCGDDGEGKHREFDGHRKSGGVDLYPGGARAEHTE